MDHVLKKGLDVPIAGAASGEIVELEQPTTVAYCPVEMPGLVPRLAAKQGAEVKVGTVVFYHKLFPEMVFRSPVAGTVKEVRRGHRRVITDYVLEASGEGEETFASYSAEQLAGMEREVAQKAVLATGLWPSITTRPLDKIAEPGVVPQAILISATESGPLMPGADVLVGEGDGPALQAAVNALSKLTDGAVHFVQRAGQNHSAFSSLTGVTTHRFSGPHPSGDAGVQVNHICPPKGTGKVWVLKAWDAVLIGQALLTGKYPTQRVYAAVGAGAAKPRFVRTTVGAPLQHIVGEAKPGEARWIRGSVLTGEAVDADRWASFSRRGVHVLPAEVPRFLFGWALPALGRWSFHKAFLSGFTGAPSGGVDMRPGLNGGHRAMVPIGVYNHVIATPDLLPDFLFKAIIAGDLEESISLGLLDITMEEAALCSYICPSKIGFTKILRDGLDLYEREA